MALLDVAFIILSPDLSMYDLDGDGFITREDLEDVILSVREMSVNV